jgi:phage antirepressor YoqD-like protein
LSEGAKAAFLLEVCMNGLQSYDFGKYENEKKMTIREVAEKFGVSEKHIRFTITVLFPEKLINGVKTYLNEKEVTAIKLEIQKNPHLDQSVELPKTKLEKMLLIKQAEQFRDEMIAELQIENERLGQKVISDAPKVESFEALQRSDKNMSITEASKHFGLHPKTQVFPFLRKHLYLTSKDLPSQKALNEGVLIERQTQGNDGVYRGQAVVESAHLEVWRTRLIPAIEKELV